MIPDESPTIEQLVSRLATDKVLALLLEQIHELQAEVELVREMLAKQPGMPGEKWVFDRRLAILSTITSEWRARVEHQD